MIFNSLKIYIGTDEILETFQEPLNITWTRYPDSTAIAVNTEGKIVARLATFDDYPIRIHFDHIEIDGCLRETDPEQYAFWMIS